MRGAGDTQMPACAQAQVLVRGSHPCVQMWWDRKHPRADILPSEQTPPPPVDRMIDTRL